MGAGTFALHHRQRPVLREVPAALDSPAELEMLRAENTRLHARVSELEALLASSKASPAQPGEERRARR